VETSRTSQKTIMLDLVELLNSLTTNTTENVLTAAALSQGNALHIPTHSAACLESINLNNISNSLLHQWQLMQPPLKEVGWALLEVANLVHHNTQHHNLILLNHSLPQHPNPTNRLQLPTIHLAQLLHPNTAGLLPPLRKTLIHMIDNILNRPLHRTLRVSSVSLSRSTGEHPPLTHLHPLQQAASIQLLTRTTIVLPITRMVIDLIVLLQPFFHQ